jgi:hypothetical protein
MRETRRELGVSYTIFETCGVNYWERFQIHKGVLGKAFGIWKNSSLEIWGNP